jgi:hypothetical protein
MIDLETMGQRFDAPIVSIGAVFFDPTTGELGREFYVAIDIEDSFRFGKASGGTVKWWMQQSDAARLAAIAGNILLGAALSELRDFYEAGVEGTSVWGNGPTFDISILEYAYMRCCGCPPPWPFWAVRDCRTIKDLGQHLSIGTKLAQGTAHNALDDALNQVRWVSEMWCELTKPQATVSDWLG